VVGGTPDNPEMWPSNERHAESRDIYRRFCSDSPVNPLGFSDWAGPPEWCPSLE
jgi:hypothetical protein